MDIQFFIELFFGGLTRGSIYALIALGYTLVYGIIGLINFAHGEVYMLGSFTALLIAGALGVYGFPAGGILIVAALAAIVWCSAYGYTLEKVAYKPLRGAPRLSPLISAIGMSIFLQNYVLLAQTSDFVPFPNLLPEMDFLEHIDYVMMSIGSWGLMIQKFIGLSAANKKALSGTERFEKAANLREAVQSLGSDPTSPLYYIAHQGVLEFNRSKELGNSSEVVVDNVRRALRQGVGTELARLQSSLSILATCANTAPFIGLFGTVWGIMSSFHSIGMLKSASLATVAPGISEALVATAIGLAVAVPATIGFNIFMGKLSQVDTLLVNFAGVFLNRVQREINAHRPVQRTGATEM